MTLNFNEQKESITTGSGVLSLSGNSGALGVPSGNTAARPSPLSAMLRFNTDTSNIEVYNGASWIVPGQSFGAEGTIVAASTTDLGSLSTNIINITGNTTINSFGTSASTANPIYIVRFSGSPTLTYNATSMILPGSLSLPIAAGDAAILEYLGSGNWKLLIHQSISGTGTYVCGTVSGTANALVVNATTPSGFQLNTGAVISFTPIDLNTGSATINVAGSGPITILKITAAGLVDLMPDDMSPGSPVLAQYNGTNWIALNIILYGVPEIISTNYAVSFSDLYNPLICTANVTLTLAATSVLGPIFTLEIFALGGVVTLTPNAGDAINGGSASASIILPQGSSVTIYNDGAGNWYVVYKGSNLNKEGTIASATTTDLGTVGSNIIGISGTTTITSLGTTANVSYPLYFVRFTGALTLTYNATSLILPGTASITTAAGDCGIFKYEGSGNWRCLSYTPASGLAPIHSPTLTGIPAAPTASGGTNTTQLATTAFVTSAVATSVGPFSSPVIGGHKNLSILVSSTTAATIAADQVVAGNGSSGFATSGAISLGIATGTSGAGGIDTGSIATSSWYSVWAIYNGTTWSSLISLSATAPTMPGGYTYKVRLGWMRTDGSSHLIKTSQYGCNVQYIANGSSTPLPIIASGSNSSVSTAASISTFIPTTAFKINVTLHGLVNNSAQAGVAPNSTYTVPAGNSYDMPIYIAHGWTNPAYMSMSGEFQIESSNVYYASSATAWLQCIGWTDNL